MGEYTKWVACWGNATSIRENTECMYAKDITLHYPIQMCFSGNKLRFHFSNITGTESVTFKACFMQFALEGKQRQLQHPILLNGKEDITIEAGKQVVSDPVCCDIQRDEYIIVQLYLPDYTQMNAGVLITGPLSMGQYSYGNHLFEKEVDIRLIRHMNWFYFLNTIDIYTEENNRAFICYGDSITAQDWPDDLTLRLQKEGITNVSVIRRAISGTRILREYDCITYAAYGRKGERRFALEMDVAGAEAVLIQHGINDMIHPVGTDVNIFRPMSDLPTAEELEKGFEEIYINHARKLGYRVYGGTLLPIEGWRTYAPFREDLRNAFNDWLRTTPLLDGCVDFDKAVCDPEHPSRFKDIYDSGDHLHPSEKGYEKMAETVDLSFM
ncbi:MAG: hypothetical protein IKR11_08980 [Solobacterium sp.]|nr:hypothetical protein [Solobacterium sp.]